VHTPFIALPNIVLNRESVPELIQRKFTAKRLADTALALLSNPKLHDKMVRDLAKTRKALGEVGAIDRATDLILGELGKIRGHRTNVD
jgi:lipid-A-disaccharide synthase